MYTADCQLEALAMNAATFTNMNLHDQEPFTIILSICLFYRTSDVGQCHFFVEKIKPVAMFCLVMV